MKRSNTLRTSLLAGGIALMGAAGASADVIRHPIPGSDFPIAQAVEVTPGTTIVYHSGTVPSPANRDAEPGTREFWGDTETQTLSVFSKLEASLKEKGLSFSDVIKMQIYLVGVPEMDGAMDFGGMMRAYTKY